MSQKQSKEQVMGGINQTMQEVADLLHTIGVQPLRKSTAEAKEQTGEVTEGNGGDLQKNLLMGYGNQDPMAMSKDDDEFPEDTPVGDPAAEVDAGMETSPQDDGQISEGEMGAEGEGEMGGAEEMAMHMSEMTDEGLHTILEIIEAELSKRSGAAEGGEMGADPAMDKGDYAMGKSDEDEDDMEKNTKEDYMKMAKSVTEMGAAMKVMADEIKSLRKSQPAKKSQGNVTSKPAATAKPQVQVLNKSDEPTKQPERLGKSDTVDFLNEQIRNGNRQVKSDHVWAAHSATSEQDLWAIQDDLRKKGLEFPKL